MRIVLDTNVFVSGIYWSGFPREILGAWKLRRVRLVVSPKILDEYQRVAQVLSARYTSSFLDSFLDLITEEAEMHEPVILKQQISRDPNDDMFIACALAADVKVVVSGDKDLLCLNEYEGIKFVSPANFVKHHLTQ